MESHTIIITMTHLKWVLGGLGVSLLVALWWNHILTLSIWDECADLLRENKKLRIEVEMVKALLTGKGVKHD
jgi:hypothetical protein